MGNKVPVCWKHQDGDVVHEGLMVVLFFLTFCMHL